MKIKILAISAVLATALFAFGAPAAKAATVEELLAQIAALQTQIAALQAQLNQQTQNQQWCHTFNTYLVAGTNSEEVEHLVGALSKENLFSTAKGSYYNFDDDVAAAVVKFQGKYGITQTGTVGPITRAKLNSLYGCKTQVCTMEAKLCPDGVTYVSRQGSNCEFAECPTTTDKSFFRNMSAACYDGSTTNMGDPTSCKPSSLWQTYADQFCKDKCSVITGKCGVNSFSVNNPCSDASQQPSITVTSPNGGETWQLADSIMNSVYTVKYTSSGLSKNDIATTYLKFSDGATCKVGSFMPYYSNDTSFNLYNGMPCLNIERAVTYGSGYKIFISVEGANASDPNNMLGKAYDESDNPFSLIPLSSDRPSVTVTSFNDAGIAFAQGQTIYINWTSKNLKPGGTFNISLWDDKGRNGTIVNNIPYAQSSYAWKIAVPMMGYGTSNDKYKTLGAWGPSSSDILLGNFKVTVSYNANTNTSVDNASDSNDNYFKIYDTSSAQPSITVTSPNGGEIWRVGETKTITWKTSNVSSPNDKITLYIALSSDLSMHCNIGQGLPNTGSYNFIVNDPSTYCANAANNSLYRPGSQFKLLACVKSSSSADLCDVVRDYSDNTFTIKEAASTGSITITSPKPSQTFSQGATIGIAWVFPTPTQPMDVSIIDASGQSVGNFFQKVSPSNAYGQSIVFLTSSSSVDKTYIAPGQYKARVCIYGTNDCAVSDTYFTVVANTGPIVNLSVNDNKSVGYQNPTVNLGKVSQATITWNSAGADHCNTYGQTKLKLTDGTTWDKSNLPTSGYAIFNTPGQVDGLGNDMYSASIGVQCWNKDSSVSDSKGIVVLWSTPPENCPVVNCVWDPCPGGHSADENGCVNCSTACRPRL